MTARKAIDENRKHNRQRRGGGNVRGESVFHGKLAEDQQALAEVIGEEPTPEFVAIMGEQVGFATEATGRKRLTEIGRRQNGRLYQQGNCHSIKLFRAHD